MARKLRPATVTMLSDITEAREHLKNAQTLICRAQCVRTAAKIASAIKSLNGAHRHALRRRDRTQEQLRAVGAPVEMPAMGPPCEGCGEAFHDHLNDPEIQTTWQQWECPCCGDWNDRKDI